MASPPPAHHPSPPCATCHAGESSGDEPLVTAEAAALANLSCRSEAALCSSATAAALSNSRRGSCGDPHASYVAVEAALEHASHSAAATSAKLDSRLSRYLLAYLVCNVPALVHTAVLMAVHYGLVTNYPFVVVMVRWTLQVCDLPISPRISPYLPVSRAYPFVVVMVRGRCSRYRASLTSSSIPTRAAATASTGAAPTRARRARGAATGCGAAGRRGGCGHRR